MRQTHPRLPLAFNYSSSFRWHKDPDPLTFGELGELGYRFIFITLFALAGYVLITGRGLSVKGQNVLVLAAIGILLSVANFLFIVATGIGYLSVTSILGSLSPVVVTAYAQVLLHERLAPRQWAGFVAVFAGIVLLSV